MKRISAGSADQEATPKRRRLEMWSPASARTEICHYLELSTGGGSGVSELVPLLYRCCDILQTCWVFEGNPGDVFEPRRYLSPLVLHILQSYAHYTTCGATGEYVALHSDEYLPFVGSVLVVLEDIIHSMQGVTGCHAPRTPLCFPTTTLASVGKKINATSVVLLVFLRGSSNGWLDSLGQDDFEAQYRRHCRTQHLIGKVLAMEDTTLGNPEEGAAPSTSGCVGSRSSAHGFPFRFVPCVAVDDAVLMDGGLNSLATSSRSRFFSAHYRYGRGPALFLSPSPRLAVASSDPRSTQADVDEASQCATERNIIRSGQALRGVDRNDADECVSPVAHGEARAQVSASGAQHPMERTVPDARPMLASTLGPVGCGERRTRFLCAHAVCVSPHGPVLIHIQVHQSRTHDVVGSDATDATNATTTTTTATTLFHMDDADRSFCEWLLVLLSAPQAVVIAEWWKNSSLGSEACAVHSAAATMLQGYIADSSRSGSNASMQRDPLGHFGLTGCSDAGEAHLAGASGDFRLACVFQRGSISVTDTTAHTRRLLNPSAPASSLEVCCAIRFVF